MSWGICNDCGRRQEADPEKRVGNSPWVEDLLVLGADPDWVMCPHCLWGFLLDKDGHLTMDASAIAGPVSEMIRKAVENEKGTGAEQEGKGPGAVEDGGT